VFFRARDYGYCGELALMAMEGSRQRGLRGRSGWTTSRNGMEKLPGVQGAGPGGTEASQRITP